MKTLLCAALGTALAVASLLGSAHAATEPKPPVAATAPVPVAPSEVITLAERVADYQLATLAAGLSPLKNAYDSPDPKGWVQGALFVGFRELAEHSDKDRYKTVLMARGQANGWQLGKRPYHADDHVIGQSYFWAAKNGAGPDALKPMQAIFDQVLAAPSNVDLKHYEYSAPGGAGCDTRWCWCDALFMSPPAWLEMAKVTGDKRYADFAIKEFWATTDYLYDPVEHLYYRDSRFFERRGPHNEKVFWSRGNGWVFAGLPLMLRQMDANDPERAKLIVIYKQMAAKLKTIQKADGYWAPSLLGDHASALPETSGTGFFVYGLAWGVENGILDRAEYEPAIRKGWAALTRAVHADGKLGWVQQISDRPEAGSFDDTQYYGVGAFLMAATAVADLDLKPAASAEATLPMARFTLNVQEGGALNDNVLKGGTFRP